MTIAKQIEEIMKSDKVDIQRVRAESNPMQALYQEMERQGYVEKQHYSIASIDALATPCHPRTVPHSDVVYW